jgi:hypothetical protein
MSLYLRIGALRFGKLQAVTDYLLTNKPQTAFQITMVYSWREPCIGNTGLMAVLVVFSIHALTTEHTCEELDKTA